MNEKEFYENAKSGAWESLKSCAEFYANHFMHPHQTIIIDQNGIELLDGQRADAFELND